jgi:hypothetical protein
VLARICEFFGCDDDKLPRCSTQLTGVTNRVKPTLLISETAASLLFIGKLLRNINWAPAF